MFLDEKQHGEAAAAAPSNLGALRVDRLLLLADEIERPTQGWIYDMRIGRCGTRACLAGHAELMFGNDGGEMAFGLTDDQRDALYMPVGWDFDRAYNDRARAARVLRHLAATGIVDWSVTP